MAEETEWGHTSATHVQGNVNEIRIKERQGACGIDPNFEISLEQCLMCGVNHDIPEFGPYCALCHDFLFPTAMQVRQRKSNKHATSQMFDPSESIEGKLGEVKLSPAGAGLESEGNKERESSQLPKGDDLEIRGLTESTEPSRYKLPYLSLYEGIRGPNVAAKRIAKKLNSMEGDVMKSLPPEILLLIFSFLDDISVSMVGQVCHLWRQLVGQSNQWRKHVFSRWPLFNAAKPTAWQKLYIDMLKGVSCRRCFEQGCVQRAIDDYPVNSGRNRRLRNELRDLLKNPTEGIHACALDASLSYWQASIKGPPDSPYEGGLFFLHIEFPKSYPFRPPLIKFITRIFHPNVSYHGDIGVNILKHDWAPILMLTKVLVSIRSLLINPYCRISMEPEIANICEKDREGFNRIAAEWSRKYAQAHLTL